MSNIPEFDSPSFGEVIAYLHGVSDGIRASRRGTASLVTCALPPVRGCRAPSSPASLGHALCDASQLIPFARRSLPYIPPPVDTAWPELASERPRWLDARSATDSAGSSNGAHRTMPYLSSAVAMDPGAPSGFPVDDRTSGVCLRVVPPPAEWYQLTGTDDDAFGSQGR